jgi:hypothetical protein
MLHPCLSQVFVLRYVKRRTKEKFRANQHEGDGQAVDQLLKEARAELEVVKRQLLVYTMYARKHKSIMVRALHTPVCVMRIASARLMLCGGLQDIPLTQVLREQADIPAEQLHATGA